VIANPHLIGPFGVGARWHSLRSVAFYQRGHGWCAGGFRLSRLDSELLCRLSPTSDSRSSRHFKQGDLKAENQASGGPKIFEIKVDH
jgi:hypothetical protein